MVVVESFTDPDQAEWQCVGIGPGNQAVDNPVQGFGAGGRLFACRTPLLDTS
jgi:hypothetical protein